VEAAVLARIERINLILAVLVTGLATALWGLRGAVAAGTGSLLACADFWLLARIGSRLAASAQAGNPSRSLSLLLVAKTMALFALVFVAIVVVRLDPIPFALGFSVFVVSFIQLGLRATLAEQGEKEV